MTDRYARDSAKTLKEQPKITDEEIERERQQRKIEEAMRKMYGGSVWPYGGIPTDDEDA